MRVPFQAFNYKISLEMVQRIEVSRICYKINREAKVFLVYQTISLKDQMLLCYMLLNFNVIVYL